METRQDARCKTDGAEWREPHREGSGAKALEKGSSISLLLRKKKKRWKKIQKLRGQRKVSPHTCHTSMVRGYGGISRDVTMRPYSHKAGGQAVCREARGARQGVEATLEGGPG